MRILLTGASGFLGRNLARYIAMNANDKVIRLSRGPQLAGEGGKESDFIQADLSCVGWTNLLPTDIDIVCHLAQSNRYREFPGGARDMVAVNIQATFELLEWARQTKVKKFIFASTGNVYAPASHPLKESDPLGPLSMYGASKVSAEFLITQYRDYFSCLILRLFGVYGRGQTGMLIPTMIQRIKLGEPITLAGGVGLRFTPLYIEDCLKMLSWTIESATGYSGAEIYNLCGSEVVTLRQIVDRLGELLDVQPNIDVIAGEFSSLIGNNRRLLDAMCYSSLTGYHQGLKKTVEN